MSTHGSTPEQPHAEKASYYTIEQVAIRTNLTKRTLRYYEEMELLPPAERTEGNYRRYTEEDIELIQHIKELRDLLGFTLNDIRNLLKAERERGEIRLAYQQETAIDQKIAALDRADAIIHEQLDLVNQKFAALKKMQSNLEEKLEKHQRMKYQLLQETTE
ncbi:MAG TPA: MerR family transcriptional regulator [Dictyobacter sp.]|jgi:DNA-binding transcriptional MerR regulator|nr:MerR family transcriptional regulator [Dictyobacter sp.]